VQGAVYASVVTNPLSDQTFSAAPAAHVALVTCAELPDLDPDDRLLRTALQQAGVRASAAIWDDPAVDWSAFDLVLLRNTWDYARRHDEFLAWAAGVPRLANPADVVAWNTDKRYLRELAAAGVPVVPTTWVAPGDGSAGPTTSWAAPTTGEWVVKPAVSAGSRDTGRYDCADAAQRSVAAEHVARLQAANRLVMVQPYLGSVDTYGETALLFLGGEYSHAIRKGPMLRGPDEGAEVLFVAENISARVPTPAEHAVAEATLRAVPGADRLLYARVDLLDTEQGPVVIELELTEPSLFFGTAPGSADRLVTAVLRHLKSLA
jgi:glutathione synthase/RimK-type ligase-like ATP-grasp enzyme